jgi:hypothetical protein
MQEDYLCHDDAHSRAGILPRPDGVSRVRRGWEGEHMELEREQPVEGAGSFAAVQLEQFRNHQIGVGYQAKHVIRQKTAPNSHIAIRDMTTCTMKETESKSKKKRAVGSQLQRYLQNDGLRKFRKELSSIESSSS